MVVAVVITWLLITTTGMKWWCSLHFCICLFVWLFIYLLIYLFPD